MKDINESARDHAVWLEGQLAGFGGVDKKALEIKHRKMREEGDHNFLRATFYRWSERWLRLEKAAPVVLSAGDIHVENFGTWRGADGALVWGINDVDEACWLPWVSDLTRLAVSVRLALTENDAAGVTADEGCSWVLEAYTEGMRGAEIPSAVIITESHGLFRLVRKLILSRSEPPEGPGAFWGEEMEKKAHVPDPDGIPGGGKAALLGALPENVLTVVGFFEPKPDRPAGNGSLGKRRYYVLAMEDNPPISTLMREAKPAVESAVSFAAGQAGIPEDPARSGLHAAAALLASPHRAPDPTQTLTAGWLLRAVSPDADKFKFEKLARKLKNAEELRCLLTCMGTEVAALHRASVGSEVAQAILRDLQRRAAVDGEWFLRLAEEHAALVRADRAAFTLTLP